MNLLINRANGVVVGGSQFDSVKGFMEKGVEEELREFSLLVWPNLDLPQRFVTRFSLMVNCARFGTEWFPLTIPS